MTPERLRNKLTERAIAVLNDKPLAYRQRMLAHLEKQEELAREIQAYADRKSKKLKQK